MKPAPARPNASRAHRRVIALGLALALCGCAKEDEELQRQLVETRGALAAKTRALEQAEAERTNRPTSAAAPTSAASAEELATAKARIAELESQLAAAKQHAAVPAAPARLDLDTLKDKLEGDLTHKAKELRELLLKQVGVARIDEIGIRAIDYPPEVIAPFRSAITFALSGSDGRQMRLVFPVTAGLDGSWSLPGPDKVQQAYKQVKDGAPAEPDVAAAPSDPSPASQATARGTTPGPLSPSTPSQVPPPGFRQVDANTFQFDWGDGAKGGASSPRTHPSAVPAPAAAPPSAPVVSAPPQEIRRAAPPTPAAPAQPEVTVPKPVMPVQRDIIIKF